MTRMTIVVDEEKVLREDIWSLEDIHRKIDWLFKEHGLKVEPNHVYYGNGRSDDLARFGVAYLTLKDSEGFVENFKECKYEEWHEDDKSDLIEEDWLNEED